MGTDSAGANGQRRSIFTWLGVLLLVAGFLGHYFAARAIGGSFVAYRDHMAGFVGIAIITGAIIALLGRFFWRARPDVTLLLIGLVQAAFGLFVYLSRYSVHG